MLLSLFQINVGACFTVSFNVWCLQLLQILDVEYKDFKFAWLDKLGNYLRSNNNPDDASPDHFDVCSLIYR